MKKLRKFWVVALALALFSSCQSPELYEEEIIDVVKFNIAMMDSYCEAYTEMSEDPSYSLAALLGYDATDELLEFYSDFEDYANELFLDGRTYYQSLEAISGVTGDDIEEIAVDILSKYNRLTVRLSDYTLVSESGNQKTWSFKELSKNIDFYFTIESGEEEDFWTCEPVEQSAEKYITKQLL